MRWLSLYRTTSAPSGPPGGDDSAHRVPTFVGIPAAAPPKPPAVGTVEYRSGSAARGGDEGAL